MKFSGYNCFLFLIVLYGCSASRKMPAISRDTSFTMRSAFIKELKNYPNIKLAQPILQPGKIAEYDITYRSHKGRKLSLDIYHDGNEALIKPLIVMIHGGGWKSGDKTMMAPLAISLLEHGYVTVNVEYRLSPEAKYPAALIDINEAVKWLKVNSRKYGIDTARIALLGVSSGGQIASLLGTLDENGLRNLHSKNTRASPRVHAVVNIDGILAFKHPESQEAQLASEWLGGTYDEIPGVWDEASALTHASNQSAPMLFINSQHDRFHAGRDDLLKRVDLNKGFEVKTLPKTPHTFWLFEPWFNDVVETTNKYLMKIFTRAIP